MGFGPPMPSDGMGVGSENQARKIFGPARVRSDELFHLFLNKKQREARAHLQLGLSPALKLNPTLPMGWVWAHIFSSKQNRTFFLPGSNSVRPAKCLGLLRYIISHVSPSNLFLPSHPSSSIVSSSSPPYTPVGATISSCHQEPAPHRRGPSSPVSASPTTVNHRHHLEPMSPSPL